MCFFRENCVYKFCENLPWALVHKTTNAPMIYVSQFVLIFDEGISIT